VEGGEQFERLVGALMALMEMDPDDKILHLKKSLGKKDLEK
jgi:hypothetical protein